MSHFTPIKDTSSSRETTGNVPALPFLYVSSQDPESTFKRDSSPEKCSICLNNLCSVYCSDDPDSIVVRTRCMHLFHDVCLQEVKERKPECPECPLCRSLLSPIEKNSRHSQTNCHIHQQITNQLRFAVVEAASRGRNAVRLALLRGSYRAGNGLIETSSVTPVC